MENLELNNKEATVGVNGQEEDENLLLLWNTCKNLQAIYLDTNEVVNSFVKQLQQIKPSLTDEEAKRLINNASYDIFRGMFYEDYITCLAYKNTKLDDYKQISYKIVEKLARILLYYRIAVNEILFERFEQYDISIMNGVICLPSKAYKAVAAAKAKAIESFEDIKKVKYTIFTEIFSFFKKKYRLSYFTNQIYDFIEQSIDRLFENVKIGYSAEIVDYEYEKSDENVYECIVKTNLNVIYHFDVSMLREIDKTLKQYNPNLSLQDAISWLKYKSDEDEDKDNVLNTILNTTLEGFYDEYEDEYEIKYEDIKIKKTYTIYHYFDDLDFKPFLLHLENLKWLQP